MLDNVPDGGADPGVDRGQLRAVAVARDALRSAEERLRQAVETARAAGETWADIGEVLGTTRQAAFQRFGRPVDPRTGQPMTAVVTDAGERAVDLLAALVQGRWEAVRRDFDDTMAGMFDADAISEVWTQLVATVGRYERMDAPFTRQIGAYTVVDVVLRFEAGETVGRVSYERAGRVAGLRLLPPS